MLFWEFNWCLLWMFVLWGWELLVYVGCIRVCMCVCRWCSSQLEKESGKGAISVQLALIASTLFWWAAAFCGMTKCCVLGLLLRPLQPLPVLEGRHPQPEEMGTGSETVNISAVVVTLFFCSLCWALPHLFTLSLLFLLLSICLVQYRCLSVSFPMCLLFHLTLLQQVYFSPTVYFIYSLPLWLSAFPGSVSSTPLPFLDFLPWIFFPGIRWSYPLAFICR